MYTTKRDAKLGDDLDASTKVMQKRALICTSSRLWDGVIFSEGKPVRMVSFNGTVNDLVVIDEAENDKLSPAITCCVRVGGKEVFCKMVKASA